MQNPMNQNPMNQNPMNQNPMNQNPMNQYFTEPNQINPNAANPNYQVGNPQQANYPGWNPQQVNYDTGNQMGVPAKPKKKIPISTVIMSIVSILLVSALIGTMVFKGNTATVTAGSGTISEKGASTPEKLMNQFAEAMAENDYTAAMACFPIQSLASNYQFANDLGTYRSWMPGRVVNGPYFPNTTDGFIELNAYSTQAMALKYVVNMKESLFLDASYLTGEVKTFEGQTEAEDFAFEYDDTKGQDLTVKRMDLKEVPESAQKNWDNMKNNYGADSLEEYTILYEADGKTYVGAAVLLQYDNKWYIHGLYGLLSGIESSGYLHEISEEDYVDEYVL